MNEPVWVWGLPLAPLKLTETVEAASALVEKGEPAFFITANTHYAMLTRESPDLNEVNARAADHRRRWSTPCLAAQAETNPAAERVAGSDLIFELCTWRPARLTASSRRALQHGRVGGLAG